MLMRLRCLFTIYYFVSCAMMFARRAMPLRAPFISPFSVALPCLFDDVILFIDAVDILIYAYALSLLFVYVDYFLMLSSFVISRAILR